MTSTRSCFSCFGKPLFSHKQGEHLTHNRSLIFKRDLEPRYLQRSRFLKPRPLCASHARRVFFCRHEVLCIVMAKHREQTLGLCLRISLMIAERERCRQIGMLGTQGSEKLFRARDSAKCNRARYRFDCQTPVLYPHWRGNPTLA